MSKQKKEYRIVYDKDEADDDATERKINELAAQGWVLRFVVPGVARSESEFFWAQFVMERDVEQGAAS